MVPSGIVLLLCFGVTSHLWQVTSHEGLHLAVNIWWKPPHWQSAVADELAAKRKLVDALSSDGFSSLVDTIPALADLRNINHGSEL